MTAAGPDNGRVRVIAAAGAPVALRDLTTTRVGGAAGEHVVATDTDGLVEAVRSADRDGVPVLVVGGGSNLLVGDDGFPGRVVVVRTRGVVVEAEDSCGGAAVRVAAGEDWDRLVSAAVDRQWLGVEALAGIPGSVGATPVQNVGAYGQEVADSIAAVRTLDRVTGRIRTIAAADCGFGYRTSRFKAEPGRFVVLEVAFALVTGTVTRTVGYAELAGRLGIAVGDAAPARDVAAAVRDLRRAKGMVLDAADPDTWSTGSFFTNPVVAVADVPADAPAWPQPDGRVKTSAAWLIQHSGFGRGWPGGGPATLSTKHTLAVTNRGTASTADVLGVARAVRDGVRERFGVTLEPEPTLVNCSL
jgi:UDP-N-acetylmuramate dehydrogenase